MKKGHKLKKPLVFRLRQCSRIIMATGILQNYWIDYEAREVSDSVASDKLAQTIKDLGRMVTVKKELMWIMVWILVFALSALLEVVQTSIAPTEIDW